MSIIIVFALITMIAMKTNGEDILSIEAARRHTISGRISDGQAFGKIHVYPQNTLPGTDRDYDAIANSGTYSSIVKLFPGLNQIEAITPTGKQTFRETFKVDKPALRVEFDCGSTRLLNLYLEKIPNEGYFLWGPITGGSIVIPEAEAGIYSVHVGPNFYDPFFWMNNYPDISASVAIFVNETKLFSSQIVWDVPDDILDDLNFYWPIESIVLHSESDTGGYLVDENGKRDIRKQGELVGLPQWNQFITDFTGNGGTGTLYLGVGKSAQFKATGNQGLCLFPDVNLYDCFYMDTISGTNVAFIDELGVLTALSPGHVQVYVWDYPTGYSVPIDVYVLKADLVPDWNHDRVIDDSDKDQATTSAPYRFWVNDDDDDSQSEVEGNDMPGGGTADASDNYLDGKRDLVDWFPVFIDLRSTLDVLDSTKFKFYLTSQDAGALHVYLDTDLTPTNVDQYLVGASVTTRLNWDMRNWLPLSTIGPAGVRLDTNFLNHAKYDGMGVVLVEAARPTTQPLRLKILDLANNEILKQDLPLSISSVTNMYRYLNLRAVAGDTTHGGLNQTNEPSNNPDALSNGKHVVFIHGFNESADDGRGNIAETFKRLYWSGSKAKYTGVAWYGDEGYWIDRNLRYHAAVINAFQTASNFADYVSSLTDEVQVVAYSLGNMVVSSAIQDWGVHPTNYFMIHAAIASESYDGNEYTTNMIEAHWFGYTNRLYASKWHMLWEDSPTDGRNSLTWRGRFANVTGPNVYNFYSTEDDVLDNSAAQFTPGGTLLSHILHWDFNFRRYAWSCQELYKGRYVAWLGGSLYGGWGFTSSTNYMTNSLLFAADRATLITDNELKGLPFFDADTPVPLLLAEPTNAVGPGSEYASTNRNTLLADMIPAISFATGRNSLDALIEPNFDRNFDMNSMKPNGWPDARFISNPLPGHGPYPWLHGDYRAVAYLYTYSIFDKIVKDIGGLNQ